jgi:hypothetical protein
MKDEGQHQHSSAGDGPGDDCPGTPVSVPNRRGNRKTAEPVIDPTTIAVNVGRLTLSSFCWVGGSVEVISLTQSTAHDDLDRGSTVDQHRQRNYRNELTDRILEIGDHLLTLGGVFRFGDRCSTRRGAPADLQDLHQRPGLTVSSYVVLSDIANIDSLTRLPRSQSI